MVVLSAPRLVLRLLSLLLLFPLLFWGLPSMLLFFGGLGLDFSVVDGCCPLRSLSRWSSVSFSRVPILCTKSHHLLAHFPIGW